MFTLTKGLPEVCTKHPHLYQNSATLLVPLLPNPYLCAMKILMVCLGNICRSPLAEGILQQKALEAGLSWQIDSAGTNGCHVGEAPHVLSQKVARLNGIDISRQRARRFTAADMDQYDRIYAMAADVVDDMRRIAGNRFVADKVKLLLEEVPPGTPQDVPDPWYGAEPGYHSVFALIATACTQIVQRATTTQQKPV
jgi:protein-tyrosine phosphatase